MRKSSRKITSAGGPIRLSPEHIAAVNRRRRIVNQFDAMDVLRLLNTDIATWMRFAFNHSDTPGNQIDSIWWDVGMMADTYPIYDSRILPRMDCPYLQKYWAKGIDWVAELVKECRERGIETFWNARNSEVDFAQPWIEGCCYTDPRCRNPLKEAHPDWVVPCWSPKGMWNLASSGLREHKVKVLRELAEKYDFDGFSLDFSRLTPCLPPGKQWRLRRHVTEYVRQVRQMLLEVARVKGRPILLAAKVPENPAGCRMDGFDVKHWIEEQLVDILVLGSRTATVAVEKFRRIAVDSPVKLVPIFDRHHTTDGYYNAPIEYLRGVYANWWAQGADSVAIFNWPCASPEDYVKQGLSTCFIPGKATYTQTIFEVGSPDTLRGKDMMFAMERRGGYPWAEGCHNRNDDRPLPCALADSGAPVTLPLFIYPNLADDTSPRQTSLAVVLWRTRMNDTIEMRLNGKVLECVDRNPEWIDGQIYGDRPVPQSGSQWWTRAGEQKLKLLRLQYAAEPGLFRRGLNKISLCVRKRGPNGGARAPIQVEKVEVYVGRRTE